MGESMTDDEFADALLAASPELQAELTPKRPVQPTPFALWDNLGLATNGSGKVIPNIDNVARLMDGPYKGILWYDTFHAKVFTKWDTDTVREWGTPDTYELTRRIQKDMQLSTISDDIVYKGLTLYGYQNARNEPYEWLESLKWDGTERIKHCMSDCFGAHENNYTSEVSQNFWIAMVARVYQPGCKYDNMIVLEGQQGAFKSSALKIIGGKWFTELHESVQNKDFFVGLQGKLLIEIAELDAFSKAETSKIKQVISNQSDRYRAPYERTAQDHPRQCIFVGSTNESQYLKDATGGRRFWPIATGLIRLDILKEHREQYFAEATHKYKNGASWWKVPEEAINEQESRRQSDEWESIIARYIEPTTEVQVTDILCDALKIEVGMQGRQEQMRVTHCLRVLGWDRTRERRSGVQVSVWRRKEDFS